MTDEGDVFSSARGREVARGDHALPRRERLSLRAGAAAARPRPRYADDRRHLRRRRGRARLRRAHRGARQRAHARLCHPPRVRPRRGRCLQPRADRSRRAPAAATSAISATCASSPSRAPSDDRVIVVVEVVEQPTGEFSFGVGYSTADGVVGDVSLTERNFLGRGYNLRVAVGGGTNSQSYEFGFTDPYFLGRRISAGVNVFRRVYDESSFRSYDYETTGGGLTFGFPITENFTRPDRLSDRVPGDRRRRRQVRSTTATRRRTTSRAPSARRRARRSSPRSSTR